MGSPNFKIINNTGAPIRTVGGEYAIDEIKYISIVELIVDNYKLVQLANDISLGLIIVEYVGTTISDTEILLIQDILATHAQPENTPKLDMLDVVGGAAVAAAGGDIELVGRNLVRTQLFDEIQLIEGGADLTIYALKPGDSGITIEMTVGAGALSISLVANKLTIELAAGGSSDDAIATAINANGASCEGILRAVSISGGNFTQAQAEADMSGGIGNYSGNKVMVGGLEALPQNEPGTAATAKWTDTGLFVTTQAVGAATDVVNIEVEVDGLLVPPLSAVLV